MYTQTQRFGRMAGALAPLFSGLVACSAPTGAGEQGEEELAEVRAVEQALEGTDFVAICNQDPRVWMNLVPLEVCVGARIFFDETFDGNGRTCGSCHPAADNFMIETSSIANIDPDDPLFVFEDPELGLDGLETTALRNQGLIKENLDGFQDNDFRFVSRAVPHTFSLATSITRDPDDGTSADFVERTGWSGDGAPGDGSLREFTNGAIVQHFTTDLDDRTEGHAFRFATEAELDQVLAFQLALGRTSDIDISTIALADTHAQEGIAAFSSDTRGRCNTCHNNAGANFAFSGKNRNFDTGVTEAPSSFVVQPDGSLLFDGGFGGQDLTAPNHVTVTGQPDALGDGTFSTPPLIEAADTAPFFHTHNFGTVEGAVAFYGLNLFQDSPAKAQLDALLGTEEMVIENQDIVDIARFLRVINAAFNLSMAKQRLKAARDLSGWFWTYRDDISFGLIELSAEEIEDARTVLEGGTPFETTGQLHPNEILLLSDLEGLLGEASGESNPAVRIQKLNTALADIDSIKSALGSGLDFQLGTANLMF